MFQFALRYCSSPFKPAVSTIVLAATLLFATSTCWGQVENVAQTTSTPTADSGHDYIHMLNETVDPSTGAVSVRINTPVPTGRKLKLPFAFAYDSSSAYFLEPDPRDNGIGAYAAQNVGALVVGGWSYTIPQLSRVGTQFTTTQKFDGSTTCAATTGYVFTDPGGGRHNLGLSHIYDYYSSTTESEACQASGYQEYDSGSDSVYSAFLTGYPHQGQNNTDPVDGTPFVADADGTVYSFPYEWGCTSFEKLPRA